MTTAIPQLFRDALTANRIFDVDGWWEAIDESSRIEAVTFWESLETECVSGFRLSGKPVEPNNSELLDQDDSGYWHDDLYEFIINHEIDMETLMKHASGICHHTAEAKQCLSIGLIPKDFRCRLRPNSCPMLNIIKLADSAVRISLAPEYKELVKNGGD